MIYKIPSNIDYILRINGTEHAYIHKDSSDYQQYLAWLAEGNTPEPADIPPEPTPLTPEEKLANAGLSITELKTLLGIK